MNVSNKITRGLDSQNRDEGINVDGVSGSDLLFYWSLDLFRICKLSLPS